MLKQQILVTTIDGSEYPEKDRAWNSFKYTKDFNSNNMYILWYCKELNNWEVFEII